MCFCGHMQRRNTDHNPPQTQRPCATTPNIQDEDDRGLRLQPEFGAPSTVGKKAAFGVRYALPSLRLHFVSGHGNLRIGRPPAISRPCPDSPTVWRRNPRLCMAVAVVLVTCERERQKKKFTASEFFVIRIFATTIVCMSVCRRCRCLSGER